MKYVAPFIAGRNFQRRRIEPTPKCCHRRSSYFRPVSNAWGAYKTLIVLHTSSSMLLECVVVWDEFYSRGGTIEIAAFL